MSKPSATSIYARGTLAPGGYQTVDSNPVLDGHPYGLLLETSIAYVLLDLVYWDKVAIPGRVPVGSSDSLPSHWPSLRAHGLVGDAFSLLDGVGAGRQMASKTPVQNPPSDLNVVPGG
jgi:hypothetical protein